MGTHVAAGHAHAPCLLVCLSRGSPGLQAALKQSFMPTSVRWLPHGLGYFLNLTFTTVRCTCLQPLKFLRVHSASEQMTTAAMPSTHLQTR